MDDTDLARVRAALARAQRIGFAAQVAVARSRDGQRARRLWRALVLGRPPELPEGTPTADRGDDEDLDLVVGNVTLDEPLHVEPWVHALLQRRLGVSACR